MRGSTSVGYDQFETSPEAIEQELRPAVCERRPTDRLKANYSIDINNNNICACRSSCVFLCAEYLIYKRTRFGRKSNR